MMNATRATMVAQFHADAELREMHQGRTDRAFGKQIKAQETSVEKQFGAAEERNKGNKKGGFLGLGGAGLGLAGAICIAVSCTGIGAIFVAAAACIAAVAALVVVKNQQAAAEMEHESGQENVEVAKQQAKAEEARSAESETSERMRQRMQVALQQQAELNKAIEL